MSADVLLATRAELFRLRRWPAVWVLAGAWCSLALLFGYVFPYVSYRTGDLSFSTDGSTPAALLAEVLPANLPSVLVQGMPMFGGALMMVLGALVAGGGYAWGTWKTVLTQGRSRVDVVLGSMASLAVVVVLAATASLLVGLSASWVVAAVEPVDAAAPDLADLATSFGGGVLVLLMWAGLGYALGTLARGPALAVGLGLVWALVVENLLRGVGSLLPAVATATDVLPGTAAGSLVGALIRSAAGGPATGGDQTPGVLDVLSGPQALAGVAAYAVVVPLLTVLLVRRRDVT